MILNWKGPEARDLPDCYRAFPDNSAGEKPDVPRSKDRLNCILWSDQCRLFFSYSDRAEVTFEDFLLVALPPKDRDRTMNKVFWNLLKNAIKFTPEGGSIFFSSRGRLDGTTLPRRGPVKPGKTAKK